MEFRELIEGFGRKCGVEESPFDGTGVAALQADDTRLTFLELPETRQILTSGTVIKSPQGDCGRLFRTLLEANHLGGATAGAAFSVSQEGMISLQRVDALSELDVELFARIIEGFLNLIDRWRTIVSGYSDAMPEIAKAEALSAEGAQGFGLGGFLQV